MPRIDALQALYNRGVRPRQGEMTMIAGRSGAQKSGFALWLALNWGLPTLYFSADMSAFQASVRIACSVLGESTEVVEAMMADPSYQSRVMHATKDVPITFSFGSPITWPGIDAELAAWVELHNSYPPLIVIDNAMDIEGASNDYTVQMEVMSALSDLSRHTGASVLILHHASDKSPEAKADPTKPPPRGDIKNGLSEKPELILTVALDPHTYEFNIAPVKQRMGFCDPSGKTYATVQCVPSMTRFLPLSSGAPTPVSI